MVFHLTRGRPSEPPPSAAPPRSARPVREGKGKKIVIYKYKRRKGFARKQGHRQPFTMLSVTDIRLG